MTDFNKLADDLSAKADFLELRIGCEDVSKMREVARILRAAAMGDVAGLMDLVRAIGTAAYEAGQRDEQGIGADACKEVAAENDFESALRMALAPKAGFVMVPVEPTYAMLEAGAGTKYEKRDRNVWSAMIAASQAGAAQEPKP